MTHKKSNGKKIRSIQKREIQKQAYNMEFPKEENGFIYVRQSSIAQLQKNIHSFEMQTDKFVEYFRRRGCTGYIEIIVDDEGMSGTMDIHEMPGLTYVMELIEGKKLIKGKKAGWGAAVHVNRFTRDKFLVKPGTIMRACYENDVWLATLRMDFNFKDEYCQRVFMIEAEESARHLEWMRLILGGGKSAASDKGYYDGRPIVPGYIIDRTDERRKKYTIYEPHAEVVQWLFRRLLGLEGNIYELCREIDKMPYLFPKFEDWVDQRDTSKFSGKRSMIQDGPYQGCYKPTVSGIQSLLCNPAYIGWWLPLDGGVIENNHEPIVDDALFTYAHKRLSTHDLNGERQKPARVTRNGQAKAILKKVLRDNEDNPIYANYDTGRNRYRQADPSGALDRKFGISIPANLVDKLFLEKFFERIEALETLDDWEDKIEERLAAKKASHEYHKNLIQKQIRDAQARWQEMFNTLNDPEIPKTKQMKIEYANQMAGLEGKITGWENELKAPDAEEEDEEVTLYQIHSLLPNIKDKWDLLPSDLQIRFVNALVKKIVLEQASPSWCYIEIHWKGAIGNFIDARHFYRVLSNEGYWSEEEENILRKLYPEEIDRVVMEALPNRSWNGIRTRAEELGIRRKRGIRKAINGGDPHAHRFTLADQEYEKKLGLSSIDMNRWSSLQGPVR